MSHGYSEVEFVKPRSLRNMTLPPRGESCNRTRQIQALLRRKQADRDRPCQGGNRLTERDPVKDKTGLQWNPLPRRRQADADRPCQDGDRLTET